MLYQGFNLYQPFETKYHIMQVFGVRQFVAVPTRNDNK
jgi:hypothetical protein